MKFTLSLLLLVATGVFTGCQSTQKVSSESNPTTDFSSYSSFFLLPLPKSIPGADPGTMLRYGNTARIAIDQIMESKGYTEANDVESADFSVNIQGKVVPKTEVTDWGFSGSYYGGRGYRYGGGYWGGGYPYGGVDVRQYEEGTLVIEIYDNESKEVVWVGWTTSRKKSGTRTDEEIYAILENILAGFPPEQF